MNELKRPWDRTLLVKRALIGAAIGVVLVLFFVLRVDEPQASWPHLWWIRPLVITPIAGACGGIVTYFIHPSLFKEPWQKILAIIATVIVYVVALWMGFVLGMDGTMWN